MQVTIIGAGIGGLTLGIALKKQGFTIKIYEAAAEFKEVGAGIILGCNAMQVYRSLGIIDALKEKGNALSRLSVTNQSLKRLSSVSLDYFVAKHKVGNYAIHRADLQAVLLSQFESGEVLLGKRLISLNKEKREVEFEGGEIESYEVLVGADGIHSQVRKQIFEKAYDIRSAKQMCWRGLIDYQLDAEFKHEFREAWGKACRVGHGQINERQVYWFALINSDEPVEKFINSDWKKAFDEFDPLIKDLLARTPDSKIHIAPITDLQQLKKWYDKDVCLIGDAAHAMTPNMGQGAGQAIEDAFALAKFLASGQENVTLAFQNFQDYRYKKVKTIVNNSWSIGKLSQINSPILRGLRNGLMKITPESVGLKGMEKTYEI